MNDISLYKNENENQTSSNIYTIYTEDQPFFIEKINQAFEQDLYSIENKRGKTPYISNREIELIDSNELNAKTASSSNRIS